MKKYDLYQDRKYMGFVNINMINNSTDKEIVEFYARFNIKVVGLNYNK